MGAMSSKSTSSPWDPSKFKYPKARREDCYDTYVSSKRGKIKVLDAYRWLEEPPDKSKETEGFIQAQAELTQRYLAQDPHRDAFKEKLIENSNYAKFSPPSLEADGYYYYSYNSGLQPQAVIYRVRKDKMPLVYDEETTPAVEELFFDTNRLSHDGSISLKTSAFSKSGTYWAYGVSDSGSDGFIVYVQETSRPNQKQQDEVIDFKPQDTSSLSDVIRFVKFCTITWLHDDSGFIYQRFPTRELDHSLTGTSPSHQAMLFFHKMGTKQADDVLITERSGHVFENQVSGDGQYLITHALIGIGVKRLTWILDLQEVDFTSKDFDGSKLKWKKIVDEWRASHTYVANDHTKFWFMTNDGAPKSKLVTYDLARPEEGFRDFISEDAEAVLKSGHLVNNDKLLIVRSVDVKDEMAVHDLYTGKLIRKIAEGVIGTFAEISAKRECQEIFYSLVRFNNPGIIYRYSFEDGQSQEKMFRKSEVRGLRPEEFTTEQVFVESTGGVKVPMFVTTPTGVPKDGTAGVLLYVYGGHSISVYPFFDPAKLTFCKYYGCAFAVVNARGGGEYGEEWHEAGMLEKQQNTFSDVQAAAEYLVAHKYAGHKRVIIEGASNGAFTALRSAEQRPDLFGATLAVVGSFEMLRYQYFTVGYTWAYEYGRSDNPDQFDFVYANSPLHNISKTNGPYPSTLLLTADNDDRVVPLHTFKTVAELQHTLPDNPAPLLMRVAFKAGHGVSQSKREAQANSLKALIDSLARVHRDRLRRPWISIVL